MNMFDVFKTGVMPKKGDFAGKKFIVDSINKDGIECHLEDDPKHKERFGHGTYESYHAPSTLWDDDSILPTWGNLKKAMEEAGLSDDTLFVTNDEYWFLRGYVSPASFDIVKLRKPCEKERRVCVLVK